MRRGQNSQSNVDPELGYTKKELLETSGLSPKTFDLIRKAARVSGKVTLAPALKDKAAPGDTVFIFARAAAGPRMPLAILRKKVSDLPAAFTLDDSTAMSPATRLSGTPQVVIGARISKSGNAMPQSGDLQGVSKPVNNAAKDIAIVIDTEVQ